MNEEQAMEERTITIDPPIYDVNADISVIYHCVGQYKVIAKQTVWVNILNHLSHNENPWITHFSELLHHTVEQHKHFETLLYFLEAHKVAWVFEALAHIQSNGVVYDQAAWDRLPRHWKD